MKTEKLVLGQRKYELLPITSASNLLAYNKESLLSKLKSAVIISEDDLPANTVCMEPVARGHLKDHT